MSVYKLIVFRKGDRLRAKHTISGLEAGALVWDELLTLCRHMHEDPAEFDFTFDGGTPVWPTLQVGQLRDHTVHMRRKETTVAQLEATLAKVNAECDAVDARHTHVSKTHDDWLKFNNDDTHEVARAEQTLHFLKLQLQTSTMALERWRGHLDASNTELDTLYTAQSKALFAVERHKLGEKRKRGL